MEVVFRLQISRQRVAAFCESLIECGWLLAIITTPLYFNIYSSRVFEPDKVALLRSIAVVILAGWLIEWLCLPRRPMPDPSPLWRALRQSSLSAPVLVIALAYALATAFSIVPRASLFGSYFRLQGTLTFLAYLILFAAATTHLRRADQVKRVLGSVALTSLPIALYALVQSLGWDPLAPWSMDVRARPPANLGNPVFLAGYLAMATVVVLGLLTARLNALAAHTGGGLTSFGMACGYGVLLALNFIAIFLTQSRGPLVALYISLVCYFCLATPVRSLRRSAIVALILLLLPAGALGLMAVRAGTGLQAQGHIGSRWAAMFDTRHGTVGIRLVIWKGVVDLLTTSKPLELSGGEIDAWHGVRPVLGYGPESLAVAFRPAGHPEIARLEGSPAFVDRAHNETLDTLATTGLLGVIGYLWLFAALTWRGLTLLGALGTQRARQQLSGMVVASVVVTGLLLTLWNGPALLGIAIPLGAVGGMFLHLGLGLLPGGPQRLVVTQDDRPAERSILLIAVIGAVLAHLIEINFGVATVTTRTHFWMFAALLAADDAAWASGFNPNVGAASAPSGDADRPTAFKSMTAGAFGTARWKEARVGALLLSLVLATLAHDFVVFDLRTASWGRLFVAGAVEAPAAIPSCAALGLFGCTWLAGCLIVLDTVTSGSLTIRGRRILGWAVASMSLGLGTLCWVLRGRELTGIGRIVPIDVASVVTLGERVARLSEHYAVVLLALVLAMALALSSSGTPRRLGALSRGGGLYDRCTVWDIGRSSVIVAVAVWLVHSVGLRPIHADTLYNVGNQLHPDHRQLTIVLYRQAAAVALYEEQYALEVQRLSSK